MTKIAFFANAFVESWTRGALATRLPDRQVCAMWVGNCFKKCAVAKK